MFFFILWQVDDGSVKQFQTEELLSTQTADLKLVADDSYSEVSCIVLKTLFCTKLIIIFIRKIIHIYILLYKYNIII